MAMRTMREGLFSAPQISWRNGFGSQPLAPESLSGDSNSFTGVKVVAAGVTEQVADKQSDSNSSRLVPKSHGVAFSMQSPCLALGFTQPPLQFQLMEQQYYRVVSPDGSQNKAILPLNMEAEDGPIYVNSKQYHGIIRRRQSRAKAASVIDQNKLSSRHRKPYMHHSRHLHALRRPRGSGGRFLNTKSLETNAKKADGTKQTLSQQSNSQNSEVLNLSNGLNVAGSEVTSMNYFVNSSVHSHGGMVMSSKWIMDNGCYNFKT